MSRHASKLQQNEKKRVREIKERYKQDRMLPMRIVLDKEEHFEENELGNKWIYWAIEHSETAALTYLMRDDLRDYPGSTPDNLEVRDLLSYLFSTWPSLAVKAMEEKLHLLQNNTWGDRTLLHEVAEKDVNTANHIIENRTDLWEFTYNRGPSVLAFIVESHFEHQYLLLEHAELLSNLRSIRSPEISVLEARMRAIEVSQAVLQDEDIGFLPQLSGKYLIEEALKESSEARAKVLFSHSLAEHLTADKKEHLAHLAARFATGEVINAFIANPSLLALENSEGITVFEVFVSCSPELATSFLQIKPEFRKWKDNNGRSISVLLAEKKPDLENRLHSTIGKVTDGVEKVKSKSLGILK